MYDAELLKETEKEHPDAYHACVKGCMAFGNSLGEAWIHTERLIRAVQTGTTAGRDNCPPFALPLFDALTKAKVVTQT